MSFVNAILNYGPGQVSQSPMKNNEWTIHDVIFGRKIWSSGCISGSNSWCWGSSPSSTSWGSTRMIHLIGKRKKYEKYALRFPFNLLYFWYASRILHFSKSLNTRLVCYFRSSILNLCFTVCVSWTPDCCCDGGDCPTGILGLDFRKILLKKW